MPLNVEKYMHYLEEYEMSYQAKVEFLEALQLIAQTFADQAFDTPALEPLPKKAVVAEAQDLPIPEEVERLMSERLKKQPI